MSSSVHEQARALLAAADLENFDRGQHAWLQAHLAECAACRDYQAAAGSVIRALRTQPFAADSDLVRTTLVRVRARALELRQQRERNRLAGAACSFVGVSAAITIPWSWRCLEWIGAATSAASWLCQVGFAFLWIAPALIVSAVLLARGSHLAHDGEHPWQ